MLGNMLKDMLLNIRFTRFFTVLSLITLELVFSASPQANAFTINEFTVPTANSRPNGITAGPDGNLWFTEAGSSKIGRITPAGTITEFPNLSSPLMSPGGITAGPDGNIWFTEFVIGDTPSDILSNICQITPTGSIIKFPVPSYGTDVAITAGPDENIWFTHYYASGASGIGKITTGGVITIFPASGNPTGITAGPDDKIWFTESAPFVNKIGRITTAGADFTEFTFNSCPCVTNTYPEGIAVGPDGNIWFTQKNDNKIGRITTAGVVSEFTVPTANSEPRGITAGPDGNIWFTEAAGNKIGRITPAGIITEFTVPTVDGYQLGIAAGPDGNIWFTESVGNKIGQIVIAPPKAQIAAIINFFDSSVSGGTLTGTGPTATSAQGHLGALRNMLVAASDLIDSAQISQACQQLLDVYQRCDGQPQPPDFVTGQAAPQLASQIQNLITNVGCQ
jgi:streptogramin lyase